MACESFGALSTGYFSGRLGRKPVLLASGIVYIIGSVIQSIVGLGSSQSVALRVLYFGRFVGGFGVGMVSALVPSYVSECVPKSIRGRCTGMIQFANNVGIMLSCEHLRPHFRACSSLNEELMLFEISLGQLRRRPACALRRYAMADPVHRADHPRLHIHSWHVIPARVPALAR